MAMMMGIIMRMKITVFGAVVAINVIGSDRMSSHQLKGYYKDNSNDNNEAHNSNGNKNNINDNPRKKNRSG